MTDLRYPIGKFSYDGHLTEGLVMAWALRGQPHRLTAARRLDVLRRFCKYQLQLAHNVPFEVGDEAAPAFGLRILFPYDENKSETPADPRADS